MANKQIDELASLTVLDDADFMVVYDTSYSGVEAAHNITYANLETQMTLGSVNDSDFAVDGILTRSGGEGNYNVDTNSYSLSSHDHSHNIASHNDTTATGPELDTLTGGGDTTLHDHAGISENTSARHTQNSDTALGSGAVAADHGAGTLHQVVNVLYGIGGPPTANTTTIGTLFIKYIA